MKILHLIDHLGLGGSQRMLLDLLEARPRDTEHFVVSLTDRIVSDSTARLRQAGVLWRSLGAGAARPAALLQIRSILARSAPQVLQTRLDVSNTAGAFLALSIRARRTAVVLTLENDPARHYSRWSRVALGAAAKRADAVVVASASLRDAAVELDRARRIEVIPPGIDLNRFTPDAVTPPARTAFRDGASLVIGSLGRLSRQKGYDVLLEALPAILAVEPGARLVLAGEGPEHAALRRQARKLGVDHAVRFAGYVADVRPVLAALDIFVLPSRHEGFGVAFLEAMAMGVACIGTRVVGSSDAVRDGETGLLVGPEDPADLAAAIVALAGDAGRRRTLAAGGLRFAREQGDRRTMTDRLHALYADLESRATRQAS